MTDELKILFPGRDISVNGETITVKPFKFGQIARAMSLCKPVLEAARANSIMHIVDGAVLFAPDWPIRILEVMADGGEALYGFIGFSIGKPREWFDLLDMDDGIAVTKAVFEENADFFAKRILPMLGLKLAEPQKAENQEDSEKSSPDSSAQDGELMK